MNALKTQKIALTALLGLVAAAVLGASSSAFAGNIDLINSALNNSLEENANSTAEYKSNAAADRPEDHFQGRAASDDRIKLTLNGELNGGGSTNDRLKDHDNKGRLYHEKNVQAKLDSELDSIDRDVARNNARAVKRTNDKAEGFQYSEAKLPN